MNRIHPTLINLMLLTMVLILVIALLLPVIRNPREVPVKSGDYKIGRVPFTDSTYCIVKREIKDVAIGLVLPFLAFFYRRNKR